MKKIKEDEEKFNIYWWDNEGEQYEEMRNAPIGYTQHAIVRLTKGPAAMLGVVRKVLVTDSGDCTCFLWTRERGVEFPKEADITSAQT